MITVKRLKELIKDLPDEAKCYAYQGEASGIGIYVGKDVFGSKRYWWIGAGECGEDTYTEGFDNE